jgi:hypothetical protein
MKTYRVVFTLEMEHHVDASTEEEAIELAKDALVGLEDGMVLVAEEASVWRDEVEDE